MGKVDDVGKDDRPSRFSEPQRCCAKREPSGPLLQFGAGVFGVFQVTYLLTYNEILRLESPEVVRPSRVN